MGIEHKIFVHHLVESSRIVLQASQFTNDVPSYTVEVVSKTTTEYNPSFNIKHPSSCAISP